MADRRLIGFLCIILVVATIISILAFGRGEKERVRILASRTPADMPGSRPGFPSYSFELMATRDIPDLIVSTFFLTRAWPATTKPWAELEGGETVDLIQNVPRLSTIIQTLRWLEDLFGTGSLYAAYELDAGGGARLHVLDFTDTVGSIAGQDRIDDQYTVYAVLVDSLGRYLMYAGYRDFFFRRETVITEVEYQGPGISECFRSSRAIGAVGACQTITNAPMGIIHLQDLKTNDRLRVDVDLDTSEMFGHSGLLQLVMTETGDGRGPFILHMIGTRSS